MKPFSTSVYNEIRQHINSDTISTLPKEKLEEYFNALARPQSYSHFGSSEFPRVCETVKTYLMRFSQNITKQEPENKPDEPHNSVLVPSKKNKKRIDLFRITEGVIIGVLVLFIGWIFLYYLDIHLF